MKIEIRPSLFLLSDTAKPFSLVKGLQLLAAVEKGGNLQTVSKALSTRRPFGASRLRRIEAPCTAIGMTMWFIVFPNQRISA